MEQEKVLLNVEETAAYLNLGMTKTRELMRENEKSMRTLAMLRYQADRYQSVGNGSMCQRVNAEIRKLMNQMSESSKN